MKKVGVALTAGVIALALGVGGTYLVGKYTNNYTNWKPWQSTTSQTSGDSASGTGKTSGNTSEGSGSGQTSKDSTETSSNGGLKALIQGGPKFAAQVNSTKTCTATITPDNATDKTILWTTSDATKVSIATATTQSGAAQTLTLKAVFNGTITITATAEANSAAKVTFSVSVYNFVTTMTIKGFGINLSSALTQTAADGTSYADLVSGYWDLNLNYGSSGNQNAGNTHVSLSGSTISYQVGTGDEVWAILEGKGRDTSIAPDIAEAPSEIGRAHV